MLKLDRLDSHTPVSHVKLTAATQPLLQKKIKSKTGNKKKGASPVHYTGIVLKLKNLWIVVGKFPMVNTTETIAHPTCYVAHYQKDIFRAPVFCFIQLVKNHSYLC